MAVEWLDAFNDALQRSTGVVQATTQAVQAIQAPRTNTTVPVTPPQGETTPKQAAVAYQAAAKGSGVPWQLIVAGIVIFALVEW